MVPSGATAALEVEEPEVLDDAVAPALEADELEALEDAELPVLEADELDALEEAELPILEADEPALAVFCTAAELATVLSALPVAVAPALTEELLLLMPAIHFADFAGLQVPFDLHFHF